MLQRRPTTIHFVLIAVFLAISVHHFLAGVHALVTGQAIAIPASPQHNLPLSGIEAVGIGGVCIFVCLLMVWACLRKPPEIS